MLTTIKDKVKSFRSYVYDFVIFTTTSRWYREVLLDCPMDVTLLDVGIGTATSLIDNRDIVVSKRMRVVGVDYDLDYVESAQANIAASSLVDTTSVEHASIHDFNKDYNAKFDIIYFSGSFMIIPQQVEALTHCVKMLRSPVPKTPGGGNIYFTQTFEHRSLIGLYVTPYVKKLLRLLTIDFGEVTYEDDFKKVLERAKVDIVYTRPIRSSYFRTQTLVCAKPGGKKD
ncbi:type 11 methyltransferase [Angomonas deanei]|uniref:Methyltransferase domain containing protein, putative n=1 Tax=Angomonas deanei TaxID=59799 RepID=A0A7G2CHG6_9TRYP|nr:type 11 methyltransferase [Angomonas deanei]CAD2218795.1 Methyltransferase domain containing protein, putative [Angomonas deanei]|eukprot:EPY39130.1 type 11 methyltransferase [Angomonas deanei]